MTQATVDQAFRFLPLEKVHESKANPRKTFEPKALEDLTASVKEKGILQPILVRPQNGHFEIVAGARRYRAAKKAGLQEIPAVIRELTDDQALEAMVIENLQRSDVHPLEEAEGYRKLLAGAKYDVESLAAKVGKSTSYVYMRLKLTELDEASKKAFLEDRITAAHAEKIARLQEPDQKEALRLCIQEVDVAPGDRDDWGHEPKIEKSLLPVRALQRWIDDEIHTDLARMPWDMKDEKLVPKAGPCTTCPKRTGNTPALFPEVQKDSVCTDRACFKEKYNAWIDRRIKELKAQGKKAIAISEEEYNWRLDAVEWRAGVKRKGEWHDPGKRKCRNLGIGIVWEGKRRGQELDVCTAASCGVHNPKPSYSGSSGGSAQKVLTPEQALKAKRAEEAEQRKAARKRDFERALFRKALASAPPKLGIDDLRQLALKEKEMEYGGCDLLEEIFPWWGKGYGTCKKAISKLDERGCLSILRASKLIRYGEELDEKELALACKRWKVPVDRMKAEFKKKWAAEDAAAKKAEKASASADARRRAGEEIPDVQVGQAFIGVERDVLEDLLVKSKKKAKSKVLDEPTCGRCGCTEEFACPGPTGDGCSWIVLDRGTNHGLCSACVKPEELGKINPAIESALGRSRPRGGVKAKPKPRKK